MRRPSPRALSLMVTLYGRHPCNRGLMLFPPFCRQWGAIIGLRGLERVWSFCVQIRDFRGAPQVEPYRRDARGSVRQQDLHEPRTKVRGAITRTIDNYGTFDDAVAKASEPAREMAHLLRTFVAEVMPDVVEVPWPKMRMASYGVGPKKMSEHFCYISVQKNDVNLGFYYGAELPDPSRLLRGTGKLLRHVKIREPQAIKSRALRRLLKAASTHRMPGRSSK